MQHFGIQVQLTYEMPPLAEGLSILRSAEISSSGYASLDLGIY